MLVTRALPAGLVAMSLAVPMAPAQAAAAPKRPLFEMPFPCHAVRQGATYDGHSEGNYALDFNRGGGSDDLGDPVRASAGGRVDRYLRSDGAKIITIHHNSVWSTNYRHLQRFSVPDGVWVTQGQLIGRVGGTGTESSPHLHYEQQRHGDSVYIHFNGKRLDPPYHNKDHDGNTNGPDYTSHNCKVKDNSVSAVLGGHGHPWAFARGPKGNAIFKRRGNNGWTNWKGLGGNIKGNPDATLRASGKIHLVARNAGHRVVHRRQRAHGWGNGWAKISRFKVAYPPAIVSPARGKVIVFAVRASDHRVMRRSWTVRNHWGKWKRFSHPGGFTSAPDAVVRPGGIIHVVIRGRNGRIANRKLIPGKGWTHWRELKSPVTPNGSAPAIASRKAGSVDIFARGPHGRLHQRTRTAGGHWHKWHLVKDVKAHFRHGPDVVAAGPGKLHVFGRNAKGKAVWATWNAKRSKGDRWTHIRRIHRP